MSTFDKLGQGVRIAERHREKRTHEGFLADLFRGEASFRYLFPWPEQTKKDLQKEFGVEEELRAFLTLVDPEFIDQAKDVPFSFIEEMSRRGFFALKLPEDHGGKGLSQTSYANAVGLVASFSSAIVILISADNTIGAKYPILTYGTPEQKAQYLPELSKWPSGFCFTEELVGSDPAQMQTHAIRSKNTDGAVTGYHMTGKKWFTTNSAWKDGVPLAKYLAVVARIVDRPEDVETSDCFGIFIIPTDAPGVTLGPRNEFCGMRGIYNANPTFHNVFVAKDQLIGKEGDGFRIALEALNTGRIAIAAGCLASAKQALAASRWYAKRRIQWGKQIGRHEAIGSGMLVPAACDIFAMEAMTKYACALEDRKKDARLAAAVCKVFASERAWTIIDTMMQIFGGRGYETYESLSRREKTVPVERIWRDSRPSRIFEGSTQILSQWFIREGLDAFLKQGSVFLEKGNFGKKLVAAGAFLTQYLILTVPKRGFPLGEIPPPLYRHLEFVERYARKFAQALIMYSGRYLGKLMHKQLTLERFFWIAAELFAMSASISYALSFNNSFTKLQSLALADMYCRGARRRIKRYFRELHDNDDAPMRKMAEDILQGEYQFIEEGIISAVEEPR